MTTWPTIECTRGHGRHKTRQVSVNLFQPHGYDDLAQIPMELQRRFAMYVWDPDVYPVDGGPYCPAHDAVSETIVNTGIWEPQETNLTLRVCASGTADQYVLDFGSQIGWFSLLAAAVGREVIAYDADPECIRLLGENAALNGWGNRIHPRCLRFAPNGPWPVATTQPVRLAKIDVEGAEDQVVKYLMPTIERGLVDHILMEVSPVFADYYPALLGELMDAGYEAYRFPPKHVPAIPLENPETDLLPYRLTTTDTVQFWHQEDVWLRREGASW